MTDLEPFYTSKPVGKGTGLGLAVSRSIVQHMGGTLDVKSAPGKGSTFRVALSVAPTFSRPPVADRRTKPIQAKVMVVSPDTRLTRGLALSLHSADVLSVSNARAALKALQTARCDLIVCDDQLRMPSDDTLLMDHLVQAGLVDPTFLVRCTQGESIDLEDIRNRLNRLASSGSPKPRRESG